MAPRLLLLMLLAHAGASAASSKPVVLITGATGRTGALLYRALRDGGEYEVRGLVRDKAKARAVLDCGACEEAEGIYAGDVTASSTSLQTPMAGATALVILSASVPLKAANGTYYFPPGGFPKDVDYEGTAHQVAAAARAGVKHVLMVSSMGTTEPDSFLDLLGNGHALFYKLNGEGVVMSSSIPFTVVKPAGLLGEDVPGGERQLVVGHGDALIQQKKLTSIPRADVVRVLVAALADPARATSLRFDLSSDPAQPATKDLGALFDAARDVSLWGTAKPLAAEAAAAEAATATAAVA